MSIFKVGSYSTTGTATSYTPSSLATLLSVTDITPYTVLVGLKICNNTGITATASGWTADDNGGWDSGQPTEQYVMLRKGAGASGADAPAFTWGGSSIGYVFLAVAYAGRVTAGPTQLGGFDAYQYPSLGSGIVVGGTLVHVKFGDATSQFGAGPNDTGFSQAAEAQLSSVGSITVNERAAYGSTSFSGGGVGSHKGIGLIYALTHPLYGPGSGMVFG